MNTAGTGGQDLTIKSTSANAADLGTSAVTANAGKDLPAGATIQIQVDAGDVLYAIRSGAADATLAILRT